MIGCWMTGAVITWVVEDDGEAFFADVLAGDFAEDDGAMGVERERHHRTGRSADRSRLGIGQVPAAEFDVFIEQFVAAIGARTM